MRRKKKERQDRSLAGPRPCAVALSEDEDDRVNVGR